MASTSKAKGKGVSSSSFFDLKAELAKKEEEVSKSKVAGKAHAIVGGVQRPGKKPTVWARQNKGVAGRSSRDVELEAVSKPTLEAAKAALERKAQIYDKLKRGKTGGLNEKQYESLLVDFDQKARDDSDLDYSSDHVDESLTVPKPPDDEDDPIVEYQDEFGRTRSGRRSEIPRELLRRSEEPLIEDDDPYVIRGDVNYYPVYEPSAERVAEIREAAKETDPTIHYDSTRDVRDKGAGFYRFSGDEEARRKQLEELKQARLETERARTEAVLEDSSPTPATDSPTSIPESGVGVTGRGIEKRKREIEERRKALDAKRRKKVTNVAEDRDKRVPGSASNAADEFLASLEKELSSRGDAG